MSGLCHSNPVDFFKDLTSLSLSLSSDIVKASPMCHSIHPKKTAYHHKVHTTFSPAEFLTGTDMNVFIVITGLKVQAHITPRNVRPAPK